ncbi:MAG: outer membrane lipoprotein-sorting protein [Candidatus Bipolaricaulaceae bacterium]
MRKALAAFGLTVVGALTLGAGCLGTSLDEILDQVEETGFLSATGNLAGTFTITIWEDGEPTEYGFRVWAREYDEDGPVTKTLILYQKPDLVAGTLFLFHTPAQGESRLWLYLPALDLLKELVGKSREGEFISGSGITYQEVAAGFQLRDEYAPRLVGEEEVNGRPTWKVSFSPRDQAAEWSQVELWVDQESYLVLRAEFYAGGELARVIEVAELARDELGLRAALITTRDLEEDKRSEIRIVDRSAAQPPDDYFIPDNLRQLDLSGD